MKKIIEGNMYLCSKSIKHKGENFLATFCSTSYNCLAKQIMCAWIESEQKQ